MKHLGWLLLLVSACVIQKRDGEPCDSSAQCASDDCMGGICVGGDCSSESDCPSNFDCYHYSGDPLFGVGGGDACRLECVAGQCPAQWTCSSSGKYCDYVGPSVTATVSNKEPRAHETVHFEAMIDPDVSTAVSWDLGPLGTKTGKSFDMAFDAGTWSYELVVDLKDGLRRYDDGYLVACPVQGETCSTFPGNCCAGLTCNGTTLTCE